MIVNLTEELRAAVGDPPPPGFDLDEMIRRGRIRRAWSRALTGVAGVAAVGVMLAGGYASLGPRPAQPAPAAPAARPAQPPWVSLFDGPRQPSLDDNLARLDAELVHLPAGLHIPAGTRFAYDPGVYHVSWDYRGTHASIGITIESMPPASDNGCAPGHRGDSATCQRTRDTRGDVYVQHGGDPSAGQKWTDVSAWRPDDTSITIGVLSTNGSPMFSTADLLVVAYDPGLTLHP